jgi:hypothetical protein
LVSWFHKSTHSFRRLGMDCPKRSDSSDDALSSDSAFGSPSKEYLERPQSPTEQAFHVMPSKIGVSDTMLGHVLVPEEEGHHQYVRSNGERGERTQIILQTHLISRITGGCGSYSGNRNLGLCRCFYRKGSKKFRNVKQRHYCGWKNPITEKISLDC